MESLPWIESNFLVNARKWQEHDLAAESTTGPFGGLSGTTFAVEICLNFQVNRSGELDVSREQTADCNTRDCLRNLCCQFPLFLWRMLPFLTGLFFFSFIFTLHLLSQSSAVGPVLQEDCHLELLICIHAVSCLFPNLIPASVLNISSSCSSSLSSLLHTKKYPVALQVSVSTENWALLLEEALSPLDLCLSVDYPKFIREPLFHWRLLLGIELQFHADSLVNQGSNNNEEFVLQPFV